MSPTSIPHGASARYDFVLSRRKHSDAFALWRFDPDSPELLQSVPLAAEARLNAKHQVLFIGRYLLEWGPVAFEDYEASFPYRLFEFDPKAANPLVRVVQAGLWTKKKFWYLRPDFGNPDGASKAYDSGKSLWLLPLGSFLLNVIPVGGRGTFQLWNFDPSPLAPADPLPAPYTPQGAFDTIQSGHELTPLGNYVLDREIATGHCWVWSFDPQCHEPLALPARWQGSMPQFTHQHKLVAIGDLVMSWIPGHPEAKVWSFSADPQTASPLTLLRCADLPAAFDGNTTLLGIQPPLPIDPVRQLVPGTVDHMRAKIKHVVHYMVENRSFDHVCGWLYAQDQRNIRFVGHDGPFQGADPSTQFNLNGNRKVPISLYNGGKLSNHVDLDFLKQDPYHDKADVMGQLFMNGHNGYAERATPDMGGFVRNNSSELVMQGYAPEQLPVLNGLAREFAVSDEWFASMPGATDPNRAFAFTGSTVGTLNNFQNGAEYTYWPTAHRRSSIWKLLWSYGFTDWKIYNSTEWMNFVHTYHLFLQGQIPAVDADTSRYIQPIEQFKKDARAGTLPAFSVLEPVWISLAGTTSYHPGADLVAGERELNDLYEAMKSGPAWEQTLFVITFDEHGGIYDHMPPPRAANPWPNDVNDGFRFDQLGVRVPTLLVSPWIDEHTVFRSPTPVAYDHTSFMATLLQWYGIPRAQWALGDRTDQAPTFEGVLARAQPRATAPRFQPPYDKNFPLDGQRIAPGRLGDLHALMAPRVVAAIACGKLSEAEIRRVAGDIMARAVTPKALQDMLMELAERVK